jgi:hypothetical protein
LYKALKTSLLRGMRSVKAFNTMVIANSGSFVKEIIFHHVVQNVSKREKRKKHVDICMHKHGSI